MPVNLHNVEAFYWAATLKSVKQAALRLHVTEQAVAKRLRKLQDEDLRVKLIEGRPGRPLQLTAAGARFLPDAERLLHAWTASKARLGVVARELVPLRIGAIESVLHAWLAPWLEQLRREQPGIELELTVETTPELRDLMQLGALDLAFAASRPGADGVGVRRLEPMEMVFVGKRSLHRRKRYTLVQLADHGLLTFQRFSQPQVALAGMLREAGLADARVHTLSSIAAMTRLVARGFGVATLPVEAIEGLAERDELRVLPCEASLPRLPVYASWRADPASVVIDSAVESALRFAERSRSPRGNTTRSRARPAL